jgi:hypothetical protein
MGAADHLKVEIAEAFAGVAYPGDKNLVYDNSGAHLECAEVAEAFRGKHWREVELDLLRHQSAAVFFMTPGAYRFYLPAYLLASIDRYHEADTMPGSVVFSLTPPREPADEGEFRKRIGLIDAAQAKAIRGFLAFLREAHVEDFPDDQLARALSFWTSWVAAPLASGRRPRGSRGGWALVVAGLLCFAMVAVAMVSNGFVGEVAAGPVTLALPRWALPVLGLCLVLLGAILIAAHRGGSDGAARLPQS